MSDLLVIPECHRAHRNGVVQWFGRTGLRLLGWHFEGQFSSEPRLIICGGPHTSNWDFVLAMLAVMALDMKANWLAKHTIFKPPVRKLFFWLGGIPLDRTNPAGVVEQVATEIRQSEQIIIGIMPEGTRKKVEKFKTGFLRMAHAAGCPVMPGALDYQRKAIVFGEAFAAREDFEQQAAEVQDYYRQFHPKHPEKF